MQRKGENDLHFRLFSRSGGSFSRHNSQKTGPMVIALPCFRSELRAENYTFNRYWRHLHLYFRNSANSIFWGRNASQKKVCFYRKVTGIFALFDRNYFLGCYNWFKRIYLKGLELSLYVRDLKNLAPYFRRIRSWRTGEVTKLFPSWPIGGLFFLLSKLWCVAILAHFTKNCEFRMW